MPLISSLENDLKAVFTLRQARERVRWKGIYKRRRALFRNSVVFCFFAVKNN